MNEPFALVPVQDPFCARVFGASATVVIGSTTEVADLAAAAGAHFVREPTGSEGLNGALAAGAAHALRAGAGSLFVVPTDLAQLCDAALRAVIDALPPAPGCILDPDRHGSGTNVLGVAPATSKVFSFGEYSLERHRERALALGFRIHLHRGRELALDLDLPGDYALWEAARAAA